MGPHYTWGTISGTAYFDKSETKVIALGGTVVGWLPHPAGADPSRGSRGTQSRPIVHAGTPFFGGGRGRKGTYKGSAGDAYCR